ncbi:hypothetical protein NSQ90_26385 [Paenibacillus sp. FSL H7-0737]|uniref:hypothetical protein n=1 Tax=Paenibacillus sp. FSL H7-0737 TaxID=1536775 RepID=UPI0030D9E73A
MKCLPSSTVREKAAQSWSLGGLLLYRNSIYVGLCPGISTAKSGFNQEIWGQQRPEVQLFTAVTTVL